MVWMKSEYQMLITDHKVRKENDKLRIALRTPRVHCKLYLWKTKLAHHERKYFLWVEKDAWPLKAGGLFPENTDVKGLLTRWTTVTHTCFIPKFCRRPHCFSLLVLNPFPCNPYSILQISLIYFAATTNTHTNGHTAFSELFSLKRTGFSTRLQNLISTYFHWIRLKREIKFSPLYPDGYRAWRFECGDYYGWQGNLRSIPRRCNFPVTWDRRLAATEK